MITIFLSQITINGLHDIYFCTLAVLINRLLVTIWSRLLSLSKCWKLILHSILYHSHIVSVIIMMVFIVILCGVSFSSVVPCFICCSLYFFMFNILLLSLLPIYSARLLLLLYRSSIYITFLLWYMVVWCCSCRIRYEYESC